jgi:hypothetical protein
MEGPSTAFFRRIAASLAWPALAACTGGTPARIVAGDADTVVVNNRRPIAIPVRLLAADGRELRASGLRWRWVSGDRLPLTPDGQVTCARSGDAEVRVSRGRLATRVVLRCRPVEGFLFPQKVEMVVGGPPAWLPVVPVGVDSRPEPLFEARVGVHDSSVAVLRDSRLVARGRGRTSVVVQVGDCRLSLVVDAVERVDSAAALLPFQEFVAPLRLVGGEVRAWRVAPGRYELRLDGDDRAGAAGVAPVLAGSETRCAPYPGGGQHYSCIARHGASVVVRHAGPVGDAPASPAILVVRRLPDVNAPVRAEHVRQRPRDDCMVRMRADGAA